jgi:hypothetical protein
MTSQWGPFFVMLIEKTKIRFSIGVDLLAWTTLASFK